MFPASNLDCKNLQVSWNIPTKTKNIIQRRFNCPVNVPPKQTMLLKKLLKTQMVQFEQNDLIKYRHTVQFEQTDLIKDTVQFEQTDLIKHTLCSLNRLI